jgi:uncharacterized protein (TIGR00299 family) protein
MSVIYFNCGSGISGDMVVGSLLDLGIDLEYLACELSKLALPGYSVSARKVNKMGVIATKFNVALEPNQPQRNQADISLLIEESALLRKVKDLSQAIFLNLAKSEALAHNTCIEKVHFHEVGCVDSIIDIVSAAILLDRLDASSVQCSTIALGCGETRTAHGVMEIPTPAVRHLLKYAPTAKTDIREELTTPTGAAIIRTITKKYTDTPPETWNIGYGAGAKDLCIPNVLETMLKN